MSKLITVGIDATNIRGGGGVTHLVEMLGAIRPYDFGIGCVVVWGGGATLNAIADNEWIHKKNPSFLNMGLLSRTIWQILFLTSEVKKAECDVLFVPGGSYSGRFHPVLTMSQNLLPFELIELKRYGFSIMTLKLILLRFTQMLTFRNSEGVIFLTDYARRVVLNITGELRGKTALISHGLNSRFFHMPKPQCDINNYNTANPYRILYVSTIDQYKHQWHVVEAISFLRREGYPVVLDLVGSSYQPALRRLNKAIARYDVNHDWVFNHGEIPFHELHHRYIAADLCLFASSCENLPNILLESMAAGLPIACSNKGPMPEILGSGGVYFNPEQPADIAHALKKLINSPDLRNFLSKANYAAAKKFSWKKCAEDTLKFLCIIATDYKGNANVQ